MRTHRNSVRAMLGQGEVNTSTSNTTILIYKQQYKGPHNSRTRSQETHCSYSTTGTPAMDSSYHYSVPYHSAEYKWIPSFARFSLPPIALPSSLRANQAESSSGLSSLLVLEDIVRLSFKLMNSIRHLLDFSKILKINISDIHS